MTDERKPSPEPTDEQIEEMRRANRAERARLLDNGATGLLARLAELEAQKGRMWAALEYYKIVGQCEVAHGKSFPRCEKSVMWKEFVNGHYWYFCDDHKTPGCSEIQANKALFTPQHKALYPGKDGPCVICGNQTESFAGDPGKWPLWFCRKGGDGIAVAHHTECVRAIMDDKDLDEVRAKVWEEAAKMLCFDCQQGHAPILWKHPEFDDADDLETYYHKTGVNYRMCTKLARKCHAKAAALRGSK